mmetsp:Transcript_20207/g.46051  ORF Transcript_20207/g.46051 Transcript_20207/m.46051 type:complete len:229 (-) Transcript_20207:458-1144(-)
MEGRHEREGLAASALAVDRRGLLGERAGGWRGLLGPGPLGQARLVHRGSLWLQGARGRPARHLDGLHHRQVALRCILGPTRGGGLWRCKWSSIGSAAQKWWSAGGASVLPGLSCRGAPDRAELLRAALRLLPGQRGHLHTEHSACQHILRAGGPAAAAVVQGCQRDLPRDAVHPCLRHPHSAERRCHNWARVPLLAMGLHPHPPGLPGCRHRPLFDPRPLHARPGGLG